jgi:hypothetical protein
MKVCAFALCALLLCACEPEPDLGRCLRSRVEHHHKDAHDDLEPVFGMDMETGDLTTHVQMVHYDAKDWDETVCDEWEFPHGRAEKEDAKR